jgi:hypothetical protein
MYTRALFGNRAGAILFLMGALTVQRGHRRKPGYEQKQGKRRK